MNTFKLALLTFALISLSHCSEDNNFRGESNLNKNGASDATNSNPDTDIQTFGTGSEDQNPDENNLAGDGDLSGDVTINQQPTNTDEVNGGINVNDGEVTLVRASFGYAQLGGNHKSMDQCATLIVNGGAPVDLGCHHSNKITNLEIDVAAAPTCNKLEVRVTVPNGVLSTADTSKVRIGTNTSEDLANYFGFKFTPIDNGDSLYVMLNDNGDKYSHSDFTFKLTGLNALKWEFAGTGFNCN